MHAVVTGFDRVAANGDVANKVGTYGLALAAHAAGIPFVAAGPSSSVDLRLPSGDGIEIEERDADEVRSALGALLTVPGTPARNPAFDVTPAELVWALVTEKGVARPAAGETPPQSGDARSSSSSSRSGIPWSPVSGISGFSRARDSSTAPRCRATRRNPRRW